MNIGNRIKQRRIDLDISAEELAVMIGKSRATIYRYENGDIENLPTTILEPLAEALETTPAYLMGWEDDPFDYDSYDLEIPEVFNGDVKRFMEYEEALSKDIAEQQRQFNDFLKSVTYAEKEAVEKYRALDPHGKKMVDFTLQEEWERSTMKTEPEAKTPSTTAEIAPMRFLSYYQRMASAGSGEFLFPDIPTEVIAVPDTPLSRRADFVIGVNGRSMENTFFDGDKVLVEKTQDVPIGKIGIFVRGTECFIKEVGEDRLISHNEDKKQYPDIIPDERRIDTIGIVLGKVGN